MCHDQHSTKTRKIANPAPIIDAFDFVSCGSNYSQGMMRKLLYLLAALAIGLTAGAATAQTAPINGSCILGATPASVQGLKSVNYLQGMIPSCTVTVYLTGTQTFATIYADGSSTPLSNPFTANSLASVNPGGWLFYALNTVAYDVVLSGGIPPITYPNPVTLTGLGAGGGGGGGGSGCAGCTPGTIPVAVAGTPVGLGDSVISQSAVGSGQSLAIHTTGTIGSSPCFSVYGLSGTPALKIQCNGSISDPQTGTVFSDGAGNMNVALGLNSHINTEDTGAGDAYFLEANFGLQTGGGSAGCGGIYALCVIPDGVSVNFSVTPSGIVSAAAASTVGGSPICTQANAGTYCPPGGAGAAVQLNPVVAQTIAIPSATSSVAQYFGQTGFQSNNVANQTFLTDTFAVYSQGYNLGPTGTTAEGWSVFKEHYDNIAFATRGIAQVNSLISSKYAQGDYADEYGYHYAAGGCVALGDECITWKANHYHQYGYLSGPLTSGAGTGSNLVVISSGNPTCTGQCGSDGPPAGAGLFMIDGGTLYDQTQSTGTAVIATLGAGPTGFTTYQYTLSSGTVTPSTAWGNIVPSTCTNNGNGQYQAYISTTCNVMLSTSPASPGSFAAGSNIFINGRWQEEALLTNAVSCGTNCQTLTFNTRYSYHPDGTGWTVMQGGPGGQVIVFNQAWPVSYWIAGATNSTTLQFGNCLTGGCSGISGSNTVAPGGISIVSGDLTMTVGSSPVANTVTAVWTVGGCGGSCGTPGNTPIGSLITVQGCSNTALNGNFTVTYSSLDIAHPEFQWVNPSASAGGSGCSIVTGPVTGTLYPSAFITGVNGSACGNVGCKGTAQLATNHVAWASGDTLVGAPQAEYHQQANVTYIGQNTAAQGGYPANGYILHNVDTVPLTSDFEASNETGTPGYSAFSIDGPFYNQIFFSGRPASNGAVLYIADGESTAGYGAKPYYLFEDDQSYLKIEADPGANVFTVSGPWDSATGSTVGGSPICTTATGCSANVGGSLTNSNLLYGTGAGTSPSATISGYDGTHTITLTTGTGTPAANGAVFTLTFSASRGHASACVVTPNLGQYSALAQVPTTAGYANATQYILTSGSTGLTASTTYTFNVSCP